MSILDAMDLPSQFGSTLLVFFLILAIVPYFSGKDFGVLKIPEFEASSKRRLRFLGPILLLVAILLHMPLLPSAASQAPSSSTEAGMKVGKDAETTADPVTSDANRHPEIDPASPSDPTLLSTPYASDHLSVENIHGLMQSGDLWCYNYAEADNSCTMVEWVERLSRDDALVRQVRMTEDGRMKFVFTQKLDFTMGGLCHTRSEEYYDSLVIYIAGSRSPQLGPLDKMVPEESRETVADKLKRIEAHHVNQTTCWRYTVAGRDEDGSIAAIKEQAFVDGIAQKNDRADIVAFFDGNEQGVRLR